MDGDKQLIGGNKGVNREQTQGRGTINEDVVVFTSKSSDGILKAVFARHLGNQLNLRTGKVDGRRNKIQSLAHIRDDDFLNGNIVEQHIVDAILHLALLNSQAA